MRYDSGNVIVSHECTTLWIIDIDYEKFLVNTSKCSPLNQRDFQKDRMMNPTVRALQLHYIKIKEKQGTKE